MTKELFNEMYELRKKEEDQEAVRVICTLEAKIKDLQDSLVYKITQKPRTFNCSYYFASKDKAITDLMIIIGDLKEDSKKREMEILAFNSLPWNKKMVYTFKEEN